MLLSALENMQFIAADTQHYRVCSVWEPTCSLDQLAILWGRLFGLTAAKRRGQGFSTRDMERPRHSSGLHEGGRHTDAPCSRHPTFVSYEQPVQNNALSKLQTAVRSLIESYVSKYALPCYVTCSTMDKPKDHRPKKSR